MSAARWARLGYTVVAWLFAAGMVIEFYLAGQGQWVTPGNYELHRNFGYLFGVLAIVLVLLSLAGRMPRLLIGGNVLLLGLTAVQPLLIRWPQIDPNVTALHPVVGLAIVGLAFWLAWSSVRQIRAYMRPDAVAPAARSAPPHPSANSDSG